MRFATLLRMKKELAIKSVYEMLISFALAEISWDMFLKDKFLGTIKNKVFYEQLRLQYIFGFSKLILYNDLETYEVFIKFTKMFAKDVDISKVSDKYGKSFWYV
jgi:hypothetical protein